MNHQAYINYFKGRAESHYLLLHNKPAPDTPTGFRVSFFKMNDGRELQQAISTQVDYPCLTLPPYHGHLSDTGDGLVNDVMTGFFEVRMKVDVPTDFDAIEAARATCKAIGLDIIAGMIREIEDMGACGPIEDLDVNSVQYDFTGPFNVYEFGCLFFFEFRDDAFNSVTMDLTGVFI